MEEKDRIEFRDKLVEMAKSMLLLNIETKGETNYMDEKMVDSDDFALETKIVKFSGIEKHLKIHIGNAEIFEEDIKDNRIIFKCPFSSINYIKVRHMQEFHKVVFCSNHGFSYKLKLSPYEADYLISNVLNAIQTKEDNDLSVPSVYIGPMDAGAKIYGSNLDLDSPFEVVLKKQLEEALKDDGIQNQTHRQKLRKSMLNGAINMSFRGIEYNAKFVQVVFDFLAKYAKIIRKIEVDSYDQYLKYNKKDEAGKEVFEMYQIVSMTLGLLRNCLFWRTAPPDIPTFKRQIAILSILTNSKNSAISIMSSLTLRNLLKVLS